MIKTRLMICLLLCAVIASALPVQKPNKKDEHDKEKQHETEQQDMATALEYERYLKEVVEALESDPDFRKKLDKAAEGDIRSGKIAQELDYVSHHVRTKLDEIKRREIERLRSLANREYELENKIDREHMKIPQHLDHGNEHTFEIEDLRKLIQKTSEDLAEADRQRRTEFKEYEMQKEFERETKLKELSDEERKKYEHDYTEQQQKHKKHEKVHHPGNQAQLEEVWEQQDHMDKKDFDPHTFFMIHDVDGNGFWDETEVKALFIKELDKVYQQGLPEDDMRERAEEMERMREHVFKETDTNHDNLISFHEFLEQTKRDEFKKDTEWETVDEQPQYTHEEYLEFEKRRQEEINRLVQEGKLPPHPNMPQGYYPNNDHQAYQQPSAGVPVQLHPNQAYHAVPHQAHNYQQVPVNQQYQAAPQYQQQYPNQPQVPVPQQQQQYHQQQMPVQHQQQQYQQQQVPVQQQPQMPVQQQYQQQPPQQQYQAVQAQNVPVQNQQQSSSIQQQQQPDQQQQQQPVQQQPPIQQQHIPPTH